MHQTLEKLYTVQFHFQRNIFPNITETLGKLTRLQHKFVRALEISQIDSFIPYIGRRKCRPTESRMALARTFIAKAIYNMPITEMLIERLKSDLSLRRLCGYERLNQIPSQSTFSRAFKEFAQMELAQKVHAFLVKEYMADNLVGHVSRDSTAINAREKPLKKAKIKQTEPKKRGRPKKGEVRKKPLTRLERQIKGMSIKEMQKDIPKACDIGTKKNSKGYKTSWQGYKLHIDCSDTGIPLSCVLTSASVHDSQVAILLAEMTNERVTSLYDLMDAAYDSPIIKQHSKKLGHVPIIDINPRKKDQKEELKTEAKARNNANYKTSESIRYNHRSSIERVNGRLKDEFGGRMVRVRGHLKVMSHLMFGIIALTIDQLMRFIE